MFVENIIRIMERKKMTRLELARRLGGVRPSYVTKILSGRAAFSDVDIQSRILTIRGAGYARS